ncbi:MAG: hypothetical protein WC004_04325 [Candidatus Absconditabacterales bacterium]
MKLLTNLNVGQKFTITDQEKDDFVLREAKRETFETYEIAKLYFATVRSFCEAMGCVLDSNTNLWFDVSDYSFKMMIAIKGFEGKIGKTVGAEIAAALASKPEDDGVEDLINNIKNIFGGNKTNSGK